MQTIKIINLSYSKLTPTLKSNIIKNIKSLNLEAYIILYYINNNR